MSNAFQVSLIIVMLKLNTQVKPHSSIITTRALLVLILVICFFQVTLEMPLRSVPKWPRTNYMYEHLSALVTVLTSYEARPFTYQQSLPGAVFKMDAEVAEQDDRFNNKHIQMVTTAAVALFSPGGGMGCFQPVVDWSNWLVLRRYVHYLLKA